MLHIMLIKYRVVALKGLKTDGLPAVAPSPSRDVAKFILSFVEGLLLGMSGDAFSPEFVEGHEPCDGRSMGIFVGSGFLKKSQASHFLALFRMKDKTIARAMTRQDEKIVLLIVLRSRLIKVPDTAIDR